jgi:ELWxxDGT repeat protein
MKTFLAIALLLLTTRVSLAQTPYLVKDLKTAGGATNADSVPSGFTTSGTDVYFSAFTNATGRELWKFDGTSVALVKDIYSGPGGSFPADLRPLSAGVLLFTAFDETHGMELWRTDGSSAGTALVKDIWAGEQGSVRILRVIDGKAYVAANDGIHGSELWITDGTEAGTQLVKNFDGDETNTYLEVPGKLGAQVIVLTDQGVWSTDGTDAGTIVLRAGMLSAAGVAVGSQIFFRGQDAASGQELWRTDGTEAGTFRLTDIGPGAESGVYTYPLTAFGNEVVFFARPNFAASWGLWRSDGTEAGTVRIADATPPRNGNVMVANGTLVYMSSGERVYGWNGVSSSLTYVPAYGGSDLFLAFGGSAHYFVSMGGSRALRRTDGTEGGTVTVSTLPVTDAIYPAFTGSKLFFSGRESATGHEPWVSETGSAESSRRLADLAIETSVSSWPSGIIAAGERVSFFAYDDNDMDRYWSSDGSSAGTLVIDDVSPGRNAPHLYTSFAGITYFARGNGLWKSDGTLAGTSLVKDLGAPIVAVRSTTRHLFVIASGDRNLWRSDGTAAGTHQMVLASGAAYTIGDIAAELAGVVFAQSWGQLWRVEESAILSPTTIQTGGAVVVAGGVMVFPAGPGASELWRSDGTGAGTYKVKTLAPSKLTVAGRYVYFLVGSKLWRTDGTEAGTVPLVDVSDSITPFWMTGVGEYLYFAHTLTGASTGRELYRTDGTVEGIQLVADIALGSDSSVPSEGRSIDGELWFSAIDSAHGQEVWKSDGSQAGTELMADVFPSRDSSGPTDFVAAGGRMFFSAVGPTVGRELWALDLEGSTFAIADARVTEGNAGARSLKFTVTRSGDLTLSASVLVSTEARTATAAVDYETRSSTLEFAAGESSKFFDVVIHGDGQSESNELLWAILSAPLNARIASGRATGIIEDDDSTTTVTSQLVRTSCGIAEGRVAVKAPADKGVPAGTVRVHRGSTFLGEFALNASGQPNEASTVVRIHLAGSAKHPVSLSFASSPASPVAAATTGVTIDTSDCTGFGTGLHVMTPCRVADSRNTSALAVAPPSRVVTVAGVCGVPANARAVAANVTAVTPSGNGTLRITPAGVVPIPLTGNVSYRTGRTRASNSILLLNSEGQVEISNLGTLPVHFIIDVFAYFQ